VLEWFRDGRLTIHYEGEMARGYVAGRGVQVDANSIRYEGTWSAGLLERGTAVYPDGRRYEGSFHRGRWSKGTLTLGVRRMAGNWYEGRLEGKGVAEGPEGRYEGNWYKGKPEGKGVFVTPDGARFTAVWRGGIPDVPGAPTPPPTLWRIGCARFGDGFALSFPTKDCSYD